MRRVLAGMLDTVAILVFVGIGRSVHGHIVGVAGMASTAWPFLVGAAIGWVAFGGWRSPADVAPAGVLTWLSCVVVGMVLRVVSGQGTAIAFVTVALAFLGAEMLGWRVAGRAVIAFNGRRSAGTAR